MRSQRKGRQFISVGRALGIITNQGFPEIACVLFSKARISRNQAEILVFINYSEKFQLNLAGEKKQVKQCL